MAEGKGPGWDTLSKAIKSIESEAKILPFLVTATTDSRHYEKLCEAIYRFSPLKLTSREIAGVSWPLSGESRLLIFLQGYVFIQKLLAPIKEAL
ncbi:hypothetical protein MASR2M78_35270 [Treponema sp.]